MTYRATPADIEAFDRDGAVLLNGVICPIGWTELPPSSSGKSKIPVLVFHGYDIVA